MFMHWGTCPSYEDVLSISVRKLHLNCLCSSVFAVSNNCFLVLLLAFAECCMLIRDSRQMLQFWILAFIKISITGGRSLPWTYCTVLPELFDNVLSFYWTPLLLTTYVKIILLDESNNTKCNDLLIQTICFTLPKVHCKAKLVISASHINSFSMLLILSPFMNRKRHSKSNKILMGNITKGVMTNFLGFFLKKVSFQFLS